MFHTPSQWLVRYPYTGCLSRHHNIFSCFYCVFLLTQNSCQVTMNFLRVECQLMNMEGIMEIQNPPLMLKLLDESLMKNKIFTQFPPTNYLLITKEKIVALQWRDLRDIILTRWANLAIINIESSQHHTSHDMMHWEEHNITSTGILSKNACIHSQGTIRYTDWRTFYKITGL